VGGEIDFSSLRGVDLFADRFGYLLEQRSPDLS
jgi:hypothetical protein